MRPVLIIMSFLLLTACSDSFNDLETYRTHVMSPDYDYYWVKEANGRKLEVRLLPPDLLAQGDYQMLTEQGMAATNEARWDSLKTPYERALYVQLTLSMSDSKSDVVYNQLQKGQEVYNTWLRKLMFGLTEYVYVQTAQGDKIKPETYDFERTYGMLPHRRVLLVFPGSLKDQEKDAKLIIKEFGMQIGRMYCDLDLPPDYPVLQL
jgi:hypothetical protein